MAARPPTQWMLVVFLFALPGSYTMTMYQRISETHVLVEIGGVYKIIIIIASL